MDPWQLILAPQTNGATNMAADLAFFQRCEAGENLSVLRIYSWRPKCISYGHSQKIERLIDCQKEKHHGWDLVRRPTGGGIVYHNEDEVSYSVITNLNNTRLPKGLLSSYRAISEVLVEALKYLGVKAEICGLEPKKRSRDSSACLPAGRSQIPLCFAEPEGHEIVSDGQKIVGSAQKRGRRAILQQGTIKIEDKFSFDEVARALICTFKKKLCYNNFDERTKGSPLLQNAA